MVQFGADLQWVSAFPTEEEVLFPPLTVSSAKAPWPPGCAAFLPAFLMTGLNLHDVCSLQYLQPTGRVQLISAGDNSFKVVEVTPHIP